MGKELLRVALATLLAASCGWAAAANCTSAASGNWNTPATWGGAGCAGAGGAPAGTPGAGDNVTIANLNHTVTINTAEAAASLNLAGGVQPTTLQIQNGGSLTVDGTVTINAPTAAV